MSAYISTAEAASRLGVTARRVQVLLGQGRLEGLRIGRTWAVAAASLRGFRRLPGGRPKALT